MVETRSPRSIRRTVDVAAPADEVFELLATPSRHGEIDGSGTVKGQFTGPRRLGPGDGFRMRMRIGLPYVIRNEVVEYEEGRRIAWRHVGHHRWRFELEPLDPDDPAAGTRVTETFDWGVSRLPAAYELVGIPAQNARSIEATLARLVARFGLPRSAERS